MKILNAAQIREVDRKTIEDLGIPGITLMENAGVQVVQVMEEHFENIENFRIAVICGLGNNGGDGFVVVRQLYMRGITPYVYIIGQPDDIKGDARVLYNIIEKYQEIPIIVVPDAETLEMLDLSFDSYQIIVDALLGVGLNRPAEGLYARVIEIINRSPASVVSVDIPSGLYSDDYIPVESAVFADVTVTFTAPKAGLILGESYIYVGNLYTVLVGTPPQLLQTPEHTLNLIERDDVRSFFIPRKKNTHKGNYGHVAIIGGSLGMSGAVQLAGHAALRGGAGLVTLFQPEEAVRQSKGSPLEAMVCPLVSHHPGVFGPECLAPIMDALRDKDILVLGPGMGTRPETKALVRELLPNLEIPVIIDADALNCIVENLEILKKMDVPMVLTPHPGEMGRLLGKASSIIQDDRETVARNFASEYNLYLILKGFRSVVAEPGGQAWVNLTGNPGMASGGTGDVLSGLLGAFCGRINHQNPEAWVLACTTAVHLHGLAGDLAAEALCEESLMAGDLIQYLPAAIQKLVH